jgi:hypothetical protein
LSPASGGSEGRGFMCVTTLTLEALPCVLGNTAGGGGKALYAPEAALPLKRPRLDWRQKRSRLLKSEPGVSESSATSKLPEKLRLCALATEAGLWRDPDLTEVSQEKEERPRGSAKPCHNLIKLSGSELHRFDSSIRSYRL